MGVPAFFRWLSGKYDKILQQVIEQKPVEVDGVKIPIDWTKPNPNGVEYDNLYLDMNGIIHPCCHPEDRPAPRNEDEMIAIIFDYMDRLFSIVRPRKLIYMAVDGVAPRAKMNQQRSRRFRTAKETADKAAEREAARQEMIEQGLTPPPEKDASHEFDSNCITPGTEFMAHLSECLRYFIHERLGSDPAWRGLKIILSDATVPGEGEHKIIDYIRKQRANPAHDPNTMHCLFGADADLIFLALGTHEPHFHVMREDLIPMSAKPCFLCGQMGHTKDVCTGKPKDPDQPDPIVEKSFVNIRINVLREYLEHDLYVPGLPFPFDVERAMDDWVFICFFVGNDFLPHMPSLEIREGAIDRLVSIWKKNLAALGGYLTSDGTVNCHRVQVLFRDLGEQEDEIFRMRKDDEDRQKERAKRRKVEARQKRDNLVRAMEAAAVHAVESSHRSAADPGRNASAYERSRGLSQDKGTDSNKAAAAALRASLMGGGSEPSTSGPASQHSTRPGTPSQSQSQSQSQAKGEKRKAEDGDNDEEPEIPDDVRLHEEGWKERYYQTKFGVSCQDKPFVDQVAQAYMEGLCWVLAYYFQGCRSWTWYYPYHYAPFASDIAAASLKEYVEFEPNTTAFKALEQLMGVLPASSGKRFLPASWSRLMHDDASPILDFYPTDFKVDLNGKRFAWMGVALLPFIDERRLLTALEDVYSDLTDEEKARNALGADYLMVGRHHPAFNALQILYELPPNSKPVTLNPSQTQGMSGQVSRDPHGIPPGQYVLLLPSPLHSVGLPDIKVNNAISVLFWNPSYKDGTVFHPRLLKGVKMPPRVTTRDDVELGAAGGRGRGRGNMFQQQQQRNAAVADRMVRHSLGHGRPQHQHHQQHHQHRPPPQQQQPYGGGYGANPYLPQQPPMGQWQQPPMNMPPPHYMPGGFQFNQMGNGYGAGPPGPGGYGQYPMQPQQQQRMGFPQQPQQQQYHRGGHRGPQQHQRYR